MGGRGNAAARNTSTSSADYSQGYTNAGSLLRNTYKNTDEMVKAGFKALNDFSLSSLLKETNEIASDYQPWNNRTVYFIWDPDFKTWQKAAERRY